MGMMYGTPYVISESNDWSSMADIMEEMMWPYRTGLGRSFWGARWIFELVTWLLLIAVLVALTRYLWKKGDKVR